MSEDRLMEYEQDNMEDLILGFKTIKETEWQCFVKAYWETIKEELMEEIEDEFIEEYTDDWAEYVYSQWVDSEASYGDYLCDMEKDNEGQR